MIGYMGSLGSGSNKCGGARADIQREDIKLLKQHSGSAADCENCEINEEVRRLTQAKGADARVWLGESAPLT
jgi:hypothetical protein